MTILDEIIAYKRNEALPKQKDRVSPSIVAWNGRWPRRFPARLSPPCCGASGEVSIIAEVKKASPSKGLLCPDFDPTRTR